MQTTDKCHIRITCLRRDWRGMVVEVRVKKGCQASDPSSRLCFNIHKCEAHVKRHGLLTERSLTVIEPSGFLTSVTRT